jgi:predicted PurR-regulated permease PerM
MATNDTMHWRAILQVSLGITLTFLFFYMMAPFVLALLIGAILAILCYPAFVRANKYFPPTLAALVVTLAFAMLVLLPTVGAFVVGAYQLSAWLKAVHLPDRSFLHDFPETNAWKSLVQKISEWVPVDLEWAQQYTMSTIGVILDKISLFAASAISSLPGFLLAASIVLVSVFFFLLDGARLLRFLGALSPLPPMKSLELYHSFERSCRGVVLAMMASCLVQGVLVCFFFLVTGVPHAFLWGFASLFMGMVPVVGVAPITIGGIVYLVATHQVFMAVLLLGGAVVVGAADNVVRPLVMKGQSEMHPLLALVSALGAVSWIGATGIFLGPIIAAVFVTFLKIVSRELATGPRPLGAPPAA